MWFMKTILDLLSYSSVHPGRRIPFPGHVYFSRKGEKSLELWGPHADASPEVPTQTSQLKLLEAGTCLFLGSNILRMDWVILRSESLP